MGQPFMQLYVADYIADTVHLTTEQHGAYMLLLMAMWRCGGKLASDDRTMRQVTRLTLRRWHQIKGPILAMLETTEDGALTQKRLAEELQKSFSKSESRSRSGRLGVEAKALKNKKPAQAKAKALLKHLPEPEPEKEKKREKGALAPMLPGMTFPDWWPTQAWQGFVEQRRKAKKPLSDAAVEVAIRRLTELKAQGQDPVKVLEAATLASWSGLYAVNENEGTGPRMAAVAGVTIEEWVYRLTAFFVGHPDTGIALAVKRGFWDRRWGPDPKDRNGCQAPAEAWAQFRKLHPGKAA